MSTNYHTPIAPGAPANAGTINGPLGELDGALTALVAGGISLGQINLGTGMPALEIQNGAISISQSVHVVDTEGMAASDDLETIQGGVSGDILVIRTVATGRNVRVVTTGNIRTAAGTPVWLDSVDRALLLIYNGSQWVEAGNQALTRAVSDGFLIPTSQFAARAAARARTGFGARAAAAAVQPDGVAVTTSGTVTASVQSDSAYLNFASAASAGSAAGLVTTTFNLTRRTHNPRFDCLLRTAATADLANIRIWVGFFSTVPPNADTLSSGLAFRYSTVASDAGWVAVASDASTQFTSAPLTGALTTDTRYLLSIEVNSAAGTATFWVNNNAMTVISSSLPTTDLGVAVQLITTNAAAKNIRISRFAVEMD